MHSKRQLNGFIALLPFRFGAGHWIFWLNHQPNRKESDELQHVYKLSDSVWLYMTVNNQGAQPYHQSTVTI
jgi:ribosomal protein S6